MVYAGSQYCIMYYDDYISQKEKKRETTEASASICLLVATDLNTVQYTGWIGLKLCWSMFNECKNGKNVYAEMIFKMYDLLTGPKYPHVSSNIFSIDCFSPHSVLYL